MSALAPSDDEVRGFASATQSARHTAATAPARRRASTAGRIVPPALCITVYSVLAAFVYGVHPPATSSTLPLCACGDLASQVWFLAWPAYALTHGLNPLYSSFVDYPHGINLMTNTAEPLLGMLFAPFVARFGAVALLSLLMRLALALSGISMCFVLRRWTNWWPAAFIGGLLYEFSPFMVGHAQAHLFLTFVPLPPIMVALLDEMVVRRQHVIRNGVLLGFSLSAELMISAEVLAMCLFAAACSLLVLAIRHPVAAREGLTDVARGMAAGVATFVVLAGYPIWVYFRGPYHVSGPPHPLSLLEQYRSPAASLIYPTVLERFGFGSWLAKGMSLIAGNGVEHEHTTYVGVTLLFLLAFVLIRCRRVGQVQLFSLLAAGAWVLTLGRRSGNLKLPYDILLKVPIINGALDLRFSFLMYLGISIVLAIGLDRMRREGILTSMLWSRPASSAIDGAGSRAHATGRLDGAGSRRPQLVRSGACLAIAAVALVPLVPALPYTSSRAAVPALFTAPNSPLARGAVVLSFPLPISWGGDNDQAVLWQSVAGMRFKLISFRGAVAGPNHEPIRNVQLLLPPTEAERVLVWGLYGKPTPPPVGAATTTDIRVFLETYHVGAVTVVPSGPRTGAVMAYFQAALGVRPIEFHGSFIWPDVRQDLVR
jgi:hypothetical protein